MQLIKLVVYLFCQSRQSKNKKMWRLIDKLGFYTEYSTEAKAIEAWLDFDYTQELDLVFVS